MMLNPSENRKNNLKSLFLSSRIQESNKKLFCIFSVCFLLASLAGCASMNAPPTCPDSTGLQCARVDQINRRIDQGQLGLPVRSASPKKQALVGADAASPYFFSAFFPSVIKTNRPLWKRERVMRIWIAPYEDAAGNYHEASRIDTLVKLGYFGYWVTEPATINQPSSFRS